MLVKLYGERMTWVMARGIGVTKWNIYSTAIPSRHMSSLFSRGRLGSGLASNIFSSRGFEGFRQHQPTTYTGNRVLPIADGRGVAVDQGYGPLSTAELSLVWVTTCCLIGTVAPGYTMNSLFHTTLHIDSVSIP